MRNVYIVTAWGAGEVYAGSNSKKAEAAHNEAVRMVQDEIRGGRRCNHDLPVCTWRNGEQIRISGGASKYERQTQL